MSQFVIPATPTRAMLPIVGSNDMYGVRRIYCVGRNYLDHIREMKEGDERDAPFFFQKPTDPIVLDGGVVPFPPQTSDLQYEVELVVAIGARGANVHVENALDFVFGYAVGIDLTRRDRQRESFAKGLPWEVGKSFDHCAPCGSVNPVASAGHRMAGAIQLSVNGQIRQRGDLGQMIWNVPEIVAKLSDSYELVPGDIIMTGTPAGVGPVNPGDCIEAIVDGLTPLKITIGDPWLKPSVRSQ
jgi:fumarylpyruvate hydrolase